MATHGAHRLPFGVEKVNLLVLRIDDHDLSVRQHAHSANVHEGMRPFDLAADAPLFGEPPLGRLLRKGGRGHRQQCDARAHCDTGESTRPQPPTGVTDSAVGNEETLTESYEVHWRLPRLATGGRTGRIDAHQTGPAVQLGNDRIRSCRSDPRASPA